MPERDGVLTRRRFTWLTASGMLSAGFGWGCGEGAEAGRAPVSPIGADELPAGEDRLRPALQAYFEGLSLQAVASLGARFAAGQERDDLLARLEPVAVIAAQHEGPANAAEAWRAEVEGDFTDARVESLSGWQLSPTELSLCVLAWSVQ